jgi:hypothetical protein
VARKLAPSPLPLATSRTRTPLRRTNCSPSRAVSRFPPRWNESPSSMHAKPLLVNRGAAAFQLGGFSGLGHSVEPGRRCTPYWVANENVTDCTSYPESHADSIPKPRVASGSKEPPLTGRRGGQSIGWGVPKPGCPPESNDSSGYQWPTAGCLWAKNRRYNASSRIAPSVETINPAPCPGP